MSTKTRGFQKRNRRRKEGTAQSSVGKEILVAADGCLRCCEVSDLTRLALSILGQDAAVMFVISQALGAPCLLTYVAEVKNPPPFDFVEDGVADERFALSEAWLGCPVLRMSSRNPFTEGQLLQKKKKLLEGKGGSAVLAYVGSFSGEPALYLVVSDK